MYGRPTAEYAHHHPLQHGAFQPNDERSHTAQIYAYPPHPSVYQSYSQELDSAYYPSSPPQAAQPQPAAIYGPPLSQQSPPPVGHQRSMQARPSPHAYVDDPAFSTDPHANPLAHYSAFAMNSREEIVPVAPNQSYSASIRSRASVHERDLSAIYGPPRLPPSAFPPALSLPQLHPPSLHHHPSAESYHSRAPSDGSEYTRSPLSHNSYTQDPRLSDAASIHLAYDEPERPVVPPEPSPNSRRSFYEKIPSENHSHSSSSMGSKKKLHKSRPPPRSEDHASSANKSYSSSKSSSASSFARSQSGDVSLHSKSRSSLHVVNPSPEDVEHQPYAIFNPRHSYHSSSSSISSSDEPHTPPSAHGHFDHSSSYSSSKSREARGYLDDKRSKEKEKELDVHNNAEPTAVEAPPAYTAMPTPTETVAAAGPSRVTSKIEYSANNVQVTLTPAGLSIDPLQPSASHASSSSGKSSSSSRKAAGSGRLPADVQRPPLQGNTSAPELHVSPPRDVPVRPTTVPIAAPAPAVAPTAASMSSTPSASNSSPPVAKTRSRKQSVSTPPGNLDKIDELDETDPLGLGWHNSGPYDVIPKVSKAKKTDAKKRDGTARGAKIFAAQAGLDPNHGARMHPSHRTHVPVDPATTSFAVKPGQIFPPILAPQPYLRQDATPMSPQAPFSPVQRQAYLNAHMQPSGRDEGIPPLFSPTPSEMARTRESPPDRRTSMLVPPEANLSGVGTPYANSMSEGHNSASTSGSSVSGHSVPRGAVPAQSPPVPQQYQQQPPSQYNVLHRPYPNPVQPQTSQQPAPQLKSQSSRSTLSRSHTVPLNTSTRPPPPVLSPNPPPTPDIQLPPPSTYTPSHAPSVQSGRTQTSALPPNPRYMPRKLVMPTPLQPLHALPPQTPAHAQQSFGSAASSLSAGSGAQLKHSASVPVRKAQEIPMSKGSNVLRKGAGGSTGSGGGGERKEQVAGGATAVWAGRVVVVPEEAKKKDKGGIGSFLFGSGAKEKEREREREREREKERVIMEKARERDMKEREREREKGKKLSKARR